jgi:hypothetical protein
MFNVLDNTFPLYTCPLSGLPLDNKASFRAADHSPGDQFFPNVLYSFKPIGIAVIDLGLLLSFSKAEQRMQLIPRPDIAGACREAHERGTGPFNINDAFLDAPDGSWPHTFEAKQAHFLRLFYDTGGREHRSRTINVFDDFPMAFAQSPEEFHRILESLLDENLLRYAKSSRVVGDWVKGLQAWYHEVMLTPAGKQAILKLISPPIESIKMSTNSFSFGNNSNVHLVQGNGAVQTNVTGNDANVNVARGNANNQANHSAPAASLPELVETLKQSLLDATFDAHREEIDIELKRVEVQLKKPEPKKALLQSAFDTIRDIAAEYSGTAAAHATIELIKQAPALLTAAGLMIS